MAWLLTDDKRYADCAKDILLKNAKASSWADKEMMMRNPPWQAELNTAHKIFAVANAYDAIYGTLSPRAQGDCRRVLPPCDKTACRRLDTS